MKQVQISMELFRQLLQYHLVGDERDAEQIKTELTKKVSRMADHELYTKSKTDRDPVRREQARREYLDRRGILEEFRESSFPNDEDRCVSRTCRVNREDRGF